MMTFYYSMKQMLRTPLRSILFFVLVGISALLLTVGGSLLYQSSGMEREFEKIYTTIATVEQKQEEVGRFRFGMRHFRITIISIMVCMGIGFRMRYWISTGRPI